MCEVEDGWWKGRLGGRVGVFPSNFVEMCSDDKDRFQNSVEARNKKNSTSAQRSKDSELDSAKELGQKIINSSQSTPPKASEEDSKHMTTSERSIMGSKTPPDTAPRLPPKPGNDSEAFSFHKHGSLAPSSILHVNLNSFYSCLLRNFEWQWRKYLENGN